MNPARFSDGFATLFEQGGLVLWAILLASLLLWYLLVERYLFHRYAAPELRRQLREDWAARPKTLPSAAAIRRKRALVNNLRAEAGRNILALQALVAILPLLGLLGTVSGMIKVFEVITVFGT
ncbi:MAG: MotA/TolQ/ExbB proton channel family protein, partial [Pseudomonadota bacterium]